jgi:PAS domain S-box-containing protein
VATTLEQAKNYLTESTPDLVITDVLLPDGKGIDLLQKEEQGARLPLVVMTSHGDEEMAVKAMKDGALDYVVKSEATLIDMPHIAKGALREWGYMTERKQAEEALRKSEESFRELAELLPETIYEMDLRGNLTFVNRNAFNLFRYSQNDFDQGLNGFDMIDPKDRHRAMENAQKILKGEKSGLKEYTALRKDGSTFPAMLRSNAIYRGGKPIGFRGFIIDITEKKKLQDQLHQAQKMEAMGTLAGGIAHEFNNMLWLITGNVELALDDIPEGNPARHQLERVTRASLRARDLVGQILSFSRQTELERKPLNVSSIVKESLKLLRASIPKTIEIREDISIESDSVLADPTQIHQVFTNLCANAAHAMREKGGILNVSLINVVIGGDEAALHQDMSPGKYVKLTVSDTGHGMDPEIKERIFDPFFTTKEVGEGTGMGLSAAHGIVKSHGGNITVESELGEGTTFHIFFPGIESDSERQTETFETIPTGSERILFIDDEEIIVDTVKEILLRLGYEVDFKTSPNEALEAFRAQPDKLDLVITDMTMPDMTGEKLAKELMKTRPDIPIILCTGFSERISEEKAKELGIKELLMKPIVKRDMALAIRRVLNQEKEV